ncbi:MAG: phosphodiesterase [Sphingomonadales bacterium]|nr:MAG: phosphodiesterase [Sphingomonadales bacterium]
MGGEKKSLLIAQMTDIHIGFDAQAAGEEFNLSRLRAALRQLATLPTQPDMLMLTGDLTDHGDAASFAKLADALADCPFPVHPLVGNHDSRQALLNAFPNCPSEGGFIHYALEQAGLRILCLDTFEPGRHGGAFCKARADWLKMQLSAHGDTPTLIFMHHPPVVSGIDWMDPAADEDWIANFALAIEGHYQIRAIHCGHLHRPLHTGFRGIPMAVTGSIAPTVTLDLRRIDPETPDQRAMIAAEPPIMALHRWENGELLTHYQPVGDWPVLASYGPELQPMVREMFEERE